VFHEFHVLDRRANVGLWREVHLVEFLLQFNSQKAAMQELSVVDCPVEPHLLHVLVKVKKILAKRRSHACLEICVSLVGAGIVCGRKTMMMMYCKLSE